MHDTIDVMDLTPEAEQHLADAYTAWLTTVTDRGVPAPNPVWFVKEGDHIVVFTHRGSRKVHNITRQPTVSFHFNSNRMGRNTVMITGEVDITHDQAPSTVPGYLDKYRSSITDELGMTVDDFNRTFTTRLRIRPTQIRRAPDGRSAVRPPT
jgi:PPOX class probable F420-dependent enzyme